MYIFHYCFSNKDYSHPEWWTFHFWINDLNAWLRIWFLYFIWFAKMMNVQICIVFVVSSFTIYNTLWFDIYKWIHFENILSRIQQLKWSQIFIAITFCIWIGYVLREHVYWYYYIRNSKHINNRYTIRIGWCCRSPNGHYEIKILNNNMTVILIFSRISVYAV